MMNSWFDTPPSLIITVPYGKVFYLKTTCTFRCTLDWV